MSERDRHEGRVSLSQWYAAPIFNRRPASASGRSGILASALSLGPRGYGRVSALLALAALPVLCHVCHARNGKEPHW